MTMGNREPYRVRRRLHELECYNNRGKVQSQERVCVICSDYSSDKGKDVEEAEVLKRCPVLQ